MAVVVYYALLIFVTDVCGGVVVINRCCMNDTVLDSNGVCVKAEPSRWAPVVYSPSRRQLLEPGTIPVDWQYREKTRPKCQEGIEPTLFPTPLGSTTPAFILFDNGSLVLEEYHLILPVEPGGYCVDPAGCLVCIEDPPEIEGPASSHKPKVRKCCGRNAVYSEVSQSCKVSDNGSLQIANITLVAGFPICDEQGSYAISGKLDETHRLLENGLLQFEGKILSKFCIERVFEHPNDGASVFTCPGKRGPQRNDIRFTLYPMGLFLSVFFLAVTLIASCLLPSTYHVLHWRCQTNHVACLLIGDLLLAITQLSAGALDGPACVAIGES